MGCKRFLLLGIFSLFVILIVGSVSAIDITNCGTGANGLQSVKNNLGATYDLKNDINCSGINFPSIGSSSSPFTGTFDGHCFIINNFYQNGLDAYGLFNYIDGATLRNIGMKGVSITNTRSGYSPTLDVGALVGNMGSTSTRTAMVSQCFAYGTISIPNRVNSGGIMSGDTEGGLVGGLGKGNIYDSYSHVNMNMNGKGLVGGFVGFMNSNGKIYRSYSKGNVPTSNYYPGGFSGKNGLYADSIYGQCFNCYWDKQTSGESDSSRGTGLNTAQMYQNSSYVGWDFSSTGPWTINNGIDYPHLRCENRCSDTCVSLGFQCGTQTVCGVSTSCGTCTSPNVCITTGSSKGKCVRCNVNSDCGTDSFSGGFFCNSDITKRYKNYTNFTCNNPGLTTSSCSNSTAPKINESCGSGEVCSGGVCVKYSYFSDMAGVMINKSDYNDRVKLIARINATYFAIYNKSNNIKIADLSLTSPQTYTTWRTLVGEFYFNVTLTTGVQISSLNNPDPNYRYLYVSPQEKNSAPVANITNPKRRDIYKINNMINFNQSSYDLDDFMNYTWDLDDLTIVKGSTINYVNYNITHSYSIDGQKNINLSVVDERGLSDQALVSILIYDPSQVNKKYVFAGISYPKYKDVVTIIGDVEFNANDSFAVQVNASGGLKCLGGNCPIGGVVSDPDGKKGNFSMFNFKWEFDDGRDSGVINKTTYMRSFSNGDHFAKLTAILDTGETGKTITIFSYLGGSSRNCTSDRKNWFDSGVMYSTFEPNNKCKGDDLNPGTSDDCCPQDYTCQLNNSAYQCMINATCLSTPSCSSYSDPTSCNNDNCNVASKSCSMTSTSTDICGKYVGGPVGGSCRCQWVGSSCILNKTVDISIENISLLGSCVTDSITKGDCTDNQMIVTQHSSMNWDSVSLTKLGNSHYISGVLNASDAQNWAIANCQLNSCFSGTRVLACDDNSVRLNFFNWINFISAIVLIIITYILWFWFKRKKKIKKRKSKK